MFLVGTDNERLFSHLHHPFEKEPFSLMEEAATGMNPACATSPDKSRTHGWLTHPLGYARAIALRFCTSNRIGVFTFRLSSSSTISDFFNVFSAPLISAWIHVPALLCYRPRVIRLPLKRYCVLSSLDQTGTGSLSRKLAFEV